MWPAPEAWQKNCNRCAVIKLGCLIGSICVVKWKRAEHSGVKAGKELKRARVEGSDVEVESGLEDSDLVGVWLTTWPISSPSHWLRPRSDKLHP